MKVIPNVAQGDVAQKVPMMFRAQVNGRCQIQRLEKNKESDAKRWADEWTSRAEPVQSPLAAGLHTYDCQVSWRLLTNSGMDDGVIRPVIGARGLPYFPGSSMKGLFRRACNPQQAAQYCGKPLPNNDWQPGILRFHGGYPTDDEWRKHLVDVVHPQQRWQVKDDKKEGGAFVQISLYKPNLRFGISSTQPLSPAEWETIGQIWQQALARGLGSRVAAGYGQVGDSTGNTKVLYQATLKGQGQAPKLVTGEGEFRPNIFRAALRGHALRVFGGLTDAGKAEALVETLFGGISGKEGKVGLLGCKFRESQLTLDTFGRGSYAQPYYDVEGTLIWYLARPLDNPSHKSTLEKLLGHLIEFAMVFGGFGKSWRRADHRQFFSDYYQNSNKALIGCHWQWLGDQTLRRIKVWRLEKVAGFIDQVRQVAQEWIKLQGIQSPSDRWSGDWREAWHPAKVQVWGREAEDKENSEAIRWFHGPYQTELRRGQPGSSIYRTAFAGKVGQVGSLWHRMYPVVVLRKNPENRGEPIIRKTPKFLELLTIFPDGSHESDNFLRFLATESSGFRKLWGGDV